MSRNSGSGLNSGENVGFRGFRVPEMVVGIPIYNTGSTITISDSGDYYLAEDVTSTGSTITIAASNVDIDLNGYTVGFGSANADDVYGIGHTTFVQYQNVIIRDGLIQHEGLGWDCIGVVVFGIDWDVHNVGIDSQAGRFYDIGSSPNRFVVRNFVAYDNFLQSRGDYARGYYADKGIALEDRGADAFATIHNNFVVGMNSGVSTSFWGSDSTAYPTSTSLIYQNSIQTHKQKYAKSPYAIALAKSSNFDVYHNRCSSEVGRGITADGYSNGTVDGSWNINWYENAIGAKEYVDPTRTFDPNIEFPGDQATQEYGAVYLIRNRYGSSYNTYTNNNCIGSNYRASEYSNGVFLGDDSDGTNTHDITFTSNKVLINDGIIPARTACFRWAFLSGVTLATNEWQQSEDDVKEVIEGTRSGVIDDGSSPLTFTNTAPAQVTGLRVNKVSKFDTILLRWDENAEDNIWKYRVYKDGVYLGHEIYSSRRPHANVPDPFFAILDALADGGVYTVAAVTLPVLGIETVGAQSTGIDTINAIEGWQ